MATNRKSFNFRHGLQVDDTNFVINANGLVGIGSSVPTESLDVRGNAKIGGSLTVGSLEITNQSSLNGLDADNINVGITSIKSGIITSSDPAGIITYYGDARYLQGMPTSQWVDVDAGLGYISIYAAGSVGVGTIDPRFVFQVAGNTDTSVEGFTGVGIQTGGHILAAGIATAYSFSGFGTDITGINASNISNGTLNNSRLAETIESSQLKLTGIATAYSFSGFGTGITGINASNISNGTLDNDRLPEDVNLTGIITAYSFSGFGTGITGINASNISNGTLDNDRLASTVIVDNVVSTFSGDLTGTATTSSSLSGTPNIEVGIVTATNLNLTSTFYTTSNIGIGTALPTSEIQVRKASGSLVEVVSDSGEARIRVGQSVGLGNSSGVLRFGNTNKTLDLINNDTGNLNFILHGGSTGVDTGRFDWLYGQRNLELMSLTYDGKLGLGITNPTTGLHVVGTSTVTDSAWFGSHVSVSGDLTFGGSLNGNLPTIIDGSNINVVTGVSTFTNIKTTGNIIVGSGVSIGIGTDAPIVELDAREVNSMFGSISIGTGQTARTGNLVADGSVIASGVGIGTTNALQDLSIYGNIGIYPVGQVSYVEGTNLELRLNDKSTIGVGTTGSIASVDFRLAGKGINNGAASFMIPPTVTNSERVGLNTAGKEGALVFNSDTKKFQGYDGTTWHDLH